MCSHRRAVALAVSAILSFACSDAPTAPRDPDGSESTLAALVVSDAITRIAPSVSASILDGAEGVTYVSLAPGTHPEAVSVAIRNVTRNITLPRVGVIDGGFDPVAVQAAAGDRLELSFVDRVGAVTVEVASVPARRPPSIVRTSPTRGRTDVPLNVRPRIVFSEPLDPIGLSGSIELRRDGALIANDVALVDGEPWAAELVPDSDLHPGTTYELIVTQAVRDLDGSPLESPLTITFTTAPEVSSLVGLVVSEPVASPVTPGGQPATYVSLRPGSLAYPGQVRITNVNASSSETRGGQLRDGGFDPIALPAAAGDFIELVIRDEFGGTRTETVTVPLRRTPTVVRTSWTGSLGDVAIDARPQVVFSEPIDPSSLDGAVRFTIGEGVVEGRLALVSLQPWVLEFEPSMSLEPEMSYGLTILSHLRDLAGSPLQVANVLSFMTRAASFAVTERGRIAFVSTRDFGFQGPPMIYLVNPDGTGLVRLVAGDEPAWSPDGRRIAFQSHATGSPPTAQGEIHVIDADGSNRRVLVGNQALYPAWSPDGRRVAFIRDGEILTVAADGSGETTVLDATSIAALIGQIHTLAWSPDGARLAFMGTETVTPGPWRVFVVGTDGSGLRQLDLGAAGEFGPTWSPDGGRLALNFDWKIVSVAIDGSDARTHAYGLYADWSPSGSHLVYSRARGRLDCWDVGCWDRIFVTDIATGARRQLVPEAVNGVNGRYWDYDPVWSRR